MVFATQPYTAKGAGRESLFGPSLCYYEATLLPFPLPHPVPPFLPPFVRLPVRLPWAEIRLDLSILPNSSSAPILINQSIASGTATATDNGHCGRCQWALWALRALWALTHTRNLSNIAVTP
jgi:hypothetical protein